MIRIQLPRKLRATRSLIACALLAGAAFTAIPAEAATTTASGITITTNLVGSATIGQHSTFNIVVTNNTGTALTNILVGDKLPLGSKLASPISGVPVNSCVRGLNAFDCLVTSLPAGGSVTLSFQATTTTASLTNLAAFQGFIGGLFHTVATTSFNTAAAPVVAPVVARVPAPVQVAQVGQVGQAGQVTAVAPASHGRHTGD
ncbi:MAG: DUF11 domain-containing protein [Chloroflexi bacterium]|nr:MAG: DUF11 domain-containing protein [Chloroflexota bacterium]